MDTFAPHVLLGFTRDASRIDFSPVRFSIVSHEAGKLLLAQRAHWTLHCELPGAQVHSRTHGWEDPIGPGRDTGYLEKHRQALLWVLKHK